MGLTIAVLWLFIIYLPRRTAEGEGDNVTSTTEVTESVKDPEESD